LRVRIEGYEYSSFPCASCEGRRKEQSREEEGTKEHCLEGVGRKGEERRAMEKLEGKLKPRSAGSHSGIGNERVVAREKGHEL